MAIVRRFVKPVGVELSAEEVASELGLSKREVYRRFTDGVIPGHKVGERWFAWRSDVDRILYGETPKVASQEVQPNGLASLLAAMAGDGEVTFEVTIRRKNTTA